LTVYTLGAAVVVVFGAAVVVTTASSGSSAELPLPSAFEHAKREIAKTKIIKARNCLFIVFLQFK
jgi:hypothetical protein